MSELDLTGIRVFREIVECGSFTAAAERLGMAAPMVSKHVARLERQLGARLLNRTSRRMSLTEAGSLFHDQCRQVLDTLDAAVASVGQTTGVPRGELKVSAPVWCATSHFAQLLADYRHDFPEVRLDMHLSNQLVDLVSEGFDVALRLTGEPSPNLIARRLCSVPFRLVATPSCLARAQGENSKSGHRPIEMILPNYLQLERLKLPGTKEGDSIEMLAVMKSSDTTLTYHAVLADMGAAFLPGWLVDEDIAKGRLALAQRGDKELAGSLFAVYSSRRHLPPKLRSFIDFLSARLDPQVATAPVVI
ncbi:HTH-type transcriptional regulator DmlR [Paraburkholderia sediminicola]|uniref:HTH-type transcriptional regulator DmlR n=1 Tax=Paraburkholderia sediminicola TaxID=458836 RepID=A0A6J5CRW1_9BURK|nr:LysR family transcriptional regulator [Paraburkholderia sediminicola]CAB3744096.1 HTH-type transcriptional regulator DmlR [Paraburkholderia sediminicola]